GPMTGHFRSRPTSRCPRVPSLPTGRLPCRPGAGPCPFAVAPTQFEPMPQSPDPPARGKRAGPPPAGSGRRLVWFKAGTVLFLLALQEAGFRWVFPLPEVDSFNRINYTKLFLFGGLQGEAPRRGLANVKVRWESEPDGFAFDHTL